LPEQWFEDWYWGGTTVWNGPDIDAAVMLFDGIQLAGPKLTPDTFRNGLFSMPPNGGAASHAVTSEEMAFGKAAGWPWLDYSYINDFTQIYYDPNAVAKNILSYTEGTGNYYVLDGGERFTFNHFPKGEPKEFDPKGAVLWDTNYPPGDVPPAVTCPSYCPSTINHDPPTP
jgi:hypothetical protein